MESSLEARSLRPEAGFGVAAPVRAGSAVGDRDFVISGKQAMMIYSRASLGRWTPRASSVAMKVGRRYLFAGVSQATLKQ